MNLIRFRVILCLLLFCMVAQPLFAITQQECEVAGGAFKEGLCCTAATQGTLAPDIFKNPGVFLCVVAPTPQWKNAQSFDFEIQAIDRTDFVSNSERWFACDASRIGKGIQIPPSDFGTQAKAASFLCTRFGQRFAFHECCEGAECINPVTKTRQVGAVPSVLTEFTSTGGLDTFTFTAQSGLQQRVYNIAAFENPIDDFSQFQFLGLLMKMSNNFVGTVEIRDQNNFKLFEGEIADYVVGTPLKDKFFHLRIPVNPSFRRIGSIAIKIDVSRLGRALSNTIIVDRIYLSTGGSDHYCSDGAFNGADFSSLWLSDLDDQRRGFDGKLVAEVACNQNTFTWTGSACCGDDTLLGGTEYYPDQQKACWNGFVLDNTAAMEVPLTYYLGGVPIVHTYLCFDQTCTFPGRFAPYALRSNILGAYAVFATDGAQRIPVIGATEVTLPFSQVVVEDISLEVVGNQGVLFGCRASPLIKARTDVVEVGICEVRGDWYCSHNKGFDNDPSGGFPSAQRSSLKSVMPGFNLIQNPSFEVPK